LRVQKEFSMRFATAIAALIALVPGI